jgi:hypothetical protein
VEGEWGCRPLPPRRDVLDEEEWVMPILFDEEKKKFLY